MLAAITRYQSKTMKARNSLSDRGWSKAGVWIGGATLVLKAHLVFSAAPQILVTYEQPAVALNWHTPPGCVYQVQCCADVPAGVWADVATLVANSSTAAWMETSPPPGARFYRLALPHGTLIEPPEHAPAEPCACGGCAAAPVATPYLYLFSGEFHYQVEDLRVKGRGLDFVWARKYRSRLGPTTAQGNGWDYSYNIRLERWGQDLVVFDGNTRSDLYRRQADGSYVAEGLFQVGYLLADPMFIVIFPDTGMWAFLPLDGTPAQGRISWIADRNGNTLTFGYDSLGRLSQVTDTLGRMFTVLYNPDGFIAAVMDFTERTVRYDYYQDGDADGSAGDLRSVTSPFVRGTPNGNDFPQGKTTFYTYSTGLPVEALNHNLLTITDPQGQTWLQNTYATNQNPADFNFDRVTSQAWGNPDDLLMLTYTPPIPGPGNQNAIVKAILNDRVGNVSEYLYDAANRCVDQRLFTGRAVPGQWTTETQNRPANPVRTNDSPFFETQFEWNADLLLTTVLYPNGNSIHRVYESDLNPQGDPRARGNLRIQTRWPGPLAGDQSQLVETFEYATSLGGCCGFNFVTKHTDARGNVTQHGYDPYGNRTNTIYALTSITEQWAYNAFGQMTAHVLPDNGSGYRRRDAFAYYDTGWQAGYLQQQIVDASGLALTTTYEYDPVGNLTRVVDPAGHDTLYTRNALNQPVQELPPEVTTGSGIRYQKLRWYDANDNLVRIDTQNRDETGAIVSTNAYFTTITEYEILNKPTRLVEEKGGVNLDNSVLALADIPVKARSQFIVTEYGYDANRNQTVQRRPEAVNGNQSANVVQRAYDERDRLYREVLAPTDPAQSTTQKDYDGNGNRSRTSQGLESAPRVTSYLYDGYNRLIGVVDPMGNVTTNHYDANRNLTNTVIWGELLDRPGSAANVRLAETCQTYDAMNRLTRKDAAFFDPQSQAPIGAGFSATLTYYNDSSQVVAEVDDNNHTNQFVYDTANRRSVVTDAKGNRTTFTYDANGNVVTQTEVDKSDLGQPDQTFVTQSFFDNLSRLTQSVDNTAHTNRFAYDSRNNLVVVLDKRGNATRSAYDGLNRVTQTQRLMTDTGDGTGTVTNTLLTLQSWDDDSRLVAQTDDNTNSTQYAYDALDRKICNTFADASATTNIYDVHNNLLVVLDANGSRITNAYDLLDRLTNVLVAAGPGVATNTTFEGYQYDGLSRLVQAQNDNSLVTCSYDSLADLTQETQQALPGGPTRTVINSYDGVGNRLVCAYPGGRRITCTYDALNRKATVADTGGTIATYAYLGPARVERRDYGNGTRLDWSYDGLRRPASSSHYRIAGGAPIDQRSYAWDAMNNKALSLDPLLLPPPPFLPSVYRYDSANRLVHSESNSLAGIDYALDGVGNRLLVTGGGGGAYAMDATLPEPADAQMNQYTYTPFDSRAYDRQGNLISAGSRRFGYDYRNQLVQTVLGAQTNSYKYDCLGRRLEKSIAGTVTRYCYADKQEVEEQDAAGATQTTCVWGVNIDELLQSSRGGASYYYHADDLDSIQKVTDASGNVVEQYRYGDYGQPSFYDGSGGPLAGSAIGNACLFTGRRYDAETGFYFYRTRYLDPQAGRFISRDAIGLWGDAASLGNAYSYCADNPLSKTDPYGLLSTCCKKWGWCSSHGVPYWGCKGGWGNWVLTLDAGGWGACMVDIGGAEAVAACLVAIYECGASCFVPGGQVVCAACLLPTCGYMAVAAGACAVANLQLRCQ